jgi:hypothetical protein
MWDAVDGRLLQTHASWDMPVFSDISADGLWIGVKDFFTSLQVIHLQR